jgi:hypothetical protein
MTSRIAIALATASFGVAGAVMPHAAVAQTVADLVGFWTVVSVDNVSPDGKRSPAFGPDPKGVVILDGHGRYVEVILRSDLPPIAAGNRMQGTSEENQAVAQGVLAFYGPYTVAGNIVTLVVDGSSYRNWIGGDQKRTITSFTPHQMTWTNSVGSSGGLVELVARRVE